MYHLISKAVKYLANFYNFRCFSSGCASWVGRPPNCTQRHIRCCCNWYTSWEDGGSSQSLHCHAVWRWVLRCDCFMFCLCGLWLAFVVWSSVVIGLRGVFLFCYWFLWRVPVFWLVCAANPRLMGDGGIYIYIIPQ